MLLRFLLAILLMVGTVCAQTFPSTGIIDNFDRANEDPVTGNWSNNLFGTGFGCQISSNLLTKATGNPGNGCWYNAATYGAAQEVYATMPNATGHVSTSALRLVACLQNSVGTSTTQGYGLRVKKEDAANDIIQIVSFNGESFSNIGNQISQEVDNGDQVGIRIVGDNTIELYFNDAGAGWSLIDSITDSTYTCANTYLGAYIRSNTFEFDDLGGGTVVTASEETNTLFMPLIFGR